MNDNKDLKKDLDFLRDKFEQDGLQVPDNLSAEAMRKKIDTVSGVPPVSRQRKRRRRAIIAAAACVAFIAVLVPVMYDQSRPDPAADSYSDSESPGIELPAGEDGLYHFKSYAELDRQMETLLPEKSEDVYCYEENSVDSMTSADAAYSSDMTAGADSYSSSTEISNDSPMTDSVKGSAPASGSHSTTYTQVEGIDEADIVKTDGKYIYYLSSSENQVIIARAEKGKTRRVCAVNCSENKSYIRDLYVTGNKLIVIGDAWSDDISDATAVSVFDISDRSEPAPAGEYTQSGFLVSSRLIGDQLCLVTNDVSYSYAKKKNLPLVAYGTDRAEKLPIGDISCFPQVNDASFSVIGMMDLSSGRVSKDSVKTKAVLGGSDEIYCNGPHLYVTCAVQRDYGGSLFTEDSSWQTRTQILKVSLAKGKVKYQSTAFVNGWINNQFSMDESNGTFKIATTSEHDGEDVNNLFLFDEKMHEIGSVIGFAKNEHIEAVRYIKDKAYVITYEETDPLFIIDLADPTHPVIEGHVKISGFSTLLVPADDDHLLGLGFSTETTEFGEATDGVKLALFDISDPSSPKVADSLSFPGMNSPVQSDHKALLVGPNADYYAIPYEQIPESWWDDSSEFTEDAESVDEMSAAEESGAEAYGEEESEDAEIDEPTYGMLLFSAKAGKIKKLDDLKTSTQVNRCIYIGDYIYGICEDDTIEGFEVGK